MHWTQLRVSEVHRDQKWQDWKSHATWWFGKWIQSMIKMAWEWMFGCLWIVMTSYPPIAILHQLDSNMLSICVRFYYQILQKRVVQVPIGRHPVFFFLQKKIQGHLTEVIISLFFVVNISPQVFNHQIHLSRLEGFKVIWLLLSGLFGVPAKNAEEFWVNPRMTSICCMRLFLYNMHIHRCIVYIRNHYLSSVYEYVYT